MFSHKIESQRIYLHKKVRLSDSALKWVLTKDSLCLKKDSIAWEIFQSSLPEIIKW